jgi:hypothetical protein
MSKFATQHSLLERLYALDAQLAREFRGKFLVGAGLGHIGLFMAPRRGRILKPSEYWCSPINAGTFASTGGDGHHYSLLAIYGQIRDDSPVLLSRPDYSDMTCNLVAGETLHDFLCLGMLTGYFNFLYDGFNDDEHAGDDFASSLYQVDGLPPEHNEISREMLRRLASEFKLKPWQADGGARFKRIQGLRTQFQFGPDAR